MTHILPSWPLFSAFLLASLALALTPGPGVLYIVARSLAQGRRAGLASVAGVGLGNLANALLAAWGLAALFALSPAAFTVLKVGGALYLIFLGVRGLRGATRPASPAMPPDRHAFREGVVVALLNPKTLVFFAAFLPQFMTPAAPAVEQAMVLGALFVAIAMVTDTAYALAAAAFTSRLGRTLGLRVWSQRLSGGLLIGLGLMTALTDSLVKQ